MVRQRSKLSDVLQFFSSLKCGLILLGLVGTAVTLGTLILQRPMAREGQIEQIYAPQTIRLLNALGLFDVFHTWWFILLLGLLGTNITLASLERWPQVWRLFARPHALADEDFVRHLPFHREIPVGRRAGADVLAAAARKLAELRFPANPKSLEQGTLYVEKHRFARLAPYIVHTSLLIIFAGAIIDGSWGYRGFMSLGAGMRSRDVESLSGQGALRRLPFAVRCDEAGMEKYPDGTPRQYWSRLAIEENGQEVLRKQIFVNDPLTFKGVRFFQATYGSTGVPRHVVIEASRPGGPARTLRLKPNVPVPWDENGATIELADFVPDFVLEGNQISTRSSEPNNPALRLVVNTPASRPATAWILPKTADAAPPNETGFNFQFRSVEMEYTTGLQVAHEPGQELIWGGCLLLTAGLMLALYFSHTRIWGVIARDSKGRPVLLLGGQPSKYREAFERRFNELAGELETALKNSPERVAEPIPA